MTHLLVASLRIDGTCAVVSVCPQMSPLAAIQVASLMTSPFDWNAYASAGPHVYAEPVYGTVALELQWNVQHFAGAVFLADISLISPRIHVYEKIKCNMATMPHIAYT